LTAAADAPLRLRHGPAGWTTAIDDADRYEPAGGTIDVTSDDAEFCAPMLDNEPVRMPVT
jgi:hypothetical protein